MADVKPKVDEHGLSEEQYRVRIGSVLARTPFVGEEGYDPEVPARYRRLPLPFISPLFKP